MKSWLWLCILPLIAASVSGAAAQGLEARGKALLTRMCAQCHAVGKTGDSPHIGAPRFRVLGNRYDIGELTDRMTERLVSTHPDMPDFQFSTEDARAVRAYLYSIQE
jgi:mono/diheme cytochrome c family protein